MAIFSDTDELYDFLGGIFEEAVADADFGPQLAASGVVLRLNYSDPAGVVLVDMPNRKVVRGGDDSIKPTVVMTMKADVGHRFWLGKVNIPMALAKGEMRAKGPMPTILKLLPIAQQLFPRYKEMVEKAGRPELLAV